MKITRLYKLLRRPLYGSEFSISRVRVLSNILDNGPRRIQELAYAEQVTQPSMTSMVVALEKEAWVMRERDASDGRAVLISLTDLGREVVLEMRAKRAWALAVRLAARPASEVSDVVALIHSIDQLIELLEGEDGDI